MDTTTASERIRRWADEALAAQGKSPGPDGEYIDRWAMEHALQEILMVLDELDAFPENDE